MKIKKSELERIIKEEIEYVLINEGILDKLKAGASAVASGVRNVAGEIKKDFTPAVSALGSAAKFGSNVAQLYKDQQAAATTASGSTPTAASRIYNMVTDATFAARSELIIDSVFYDNSTKKVTIRARIAQGAARGAGPAIRLSGSNRLTSMDKPQLQQLLYSIMNNSISQKILNDRSNMSQSDLLNVDKSLQPFIKTKLNDFITDTTKFNDLVTKINSAISAAIAAPTP